MESTHKSNSYLQAQKESEIIEAFLNSPLYNKEKETNISQSRSIEEGGKIKMQFDLFLKKSKIIGEVYVTELPFNPGRKRKFMNDILKMLTFEKFMQNQKINSTKHYEKYYFLTASEEQLKGLDPKWEDEKFIKHSRDNSLIGKDTWLNTMLEEFEVTVYYYCLNDTFWKDLKETRAMQKDGMAGKK